MEKRAVGDVHIHESLGDILQEIEGRFRDIDHRRAALKLVATWPSEIRNLIFGGGAVWVTSDEAGQCVIVTDGRYKYSLSKVDTKVKEAVDAESRIKLDTMGDRISELAKLSASVKDSFPTLRVLSSHLSCNTTTVVKYKKMLVAILSTVDKYYPNLPVEFQDSLRSTFKLYHTPLYGLVGVIYSDESQYDDQ
jgi:hypothetical protein